MRKSAFTLACCMAAVSQPARAAQMAALDLTVVTPEQV